MAYSTPRCGTSTVLQPDTKAEGNGAEGRAACSSPARQTSRADVGEIGERIYALAAELYPICRSITGNGVRQSLQIVGRHIPIQTTELPTGTQVFDWTIPR